MGLWDFFRINLPYGLKKEPTGKWMVFNREYMPLGWSDSSTPLKESMWQDHPYSKYPVYSKYDGLTDNFIVGLVKNEEFIERNDKGEITGFFLYNDGTNPESQPQHAESYFEKIELLGHLENKLNRGY